MFRLYVFTCVPVYLCTYLLYQRMLGEKFREHVAIGDEDFGVGLFEFSETGVVGTEDEVDEPFGRGVVVDSGRVACVEEPTIVGFDGDAAMSSRVTEERNEIHFGSEGQADGVEVVPFGITRFVEDEIGFVREVARDVGVLCPLADLAVGERVVFTFVDVDFGARKIGQSADVIEVHMRENDVLHIGGIESQGADAVDRGFVHVERHVGDDAEELREPGRVGIVAQAEARVHEGESLAGFDQQAEQSRFHFGGEAGVAGEAIEQVDGHADI